MPDYQVFRSLVDGLSDFPVMVVSSDEETQVHCTKQTMVVYFLGC